MKQMKDQWLDWLQEKQRHFFYGLTVVVASLFVAFQLFGKFHAPKKSKYLLAIRDFEKWLSSGESFDKIETALREHPELETKFGALIANQFIVNHQGDQAEKYAKAVLNRVQKHLPEHASFAEGSLTIAKGQLEEALKSSLSLRQKTDSHSVLYGFNLLRIASLYRELNNHPQEVSTLTELEEFLSHNEKASHALNQSFQQNNITLSDYISHRKRDVSNRLEN